MKTLIYTKSLYALLIMFFCANTILGQQVREVQLKVKTFFESGELKTEVAFENGKPNGLFKSYHRNGEIRDVGFFQNGVQVGTWESFGEDGQLLTQGNFENGKKHGVWKIWDINGVLRFEKIYDNEVLESWKERDSNGSIVASHN